MTARRPPAKKAPTKRAAPARSRQTVYTAAQRKAALDLYTEHGPHETARRTGISVSTIARWASDAGVRTEVTPKTAAATEQASLSVARRKLDLAGQLLDDVTRLRAQLFAPCTDLSAVRLGVGEGVQEIRVAELHRPMPSFGDQKQIMIQIGIAVDKIVALTGPWAQAAAAEPGADFGVDEVAATVLRLVTKGPAGG